MSLEKGKFAFHKSLSETPFKPDRVSFFLARGNHPSFEKKAPRIWAEILASNQFRVAPRVAPRIGLSHKLVVSAVPRIAPRMPRNSENCSENAPEFRELLLEWPFHSESVFFRIGWL